MRLKSRALTAAVAVALVVTPAAVAMVASAEAPAPAAAAPPEVPSGFQDIEVIPGLSESTAVAFAPDGTAFVGLKPGIVKAFDYNSGTGQWESFATHTEVASLVTNVHNYHDRGLTGVAVDPQFGTAGHNYIYVNYAYDRDPRDNPAIVPKWGSGGGGYDDCAAPAAMGPPVVTGCVGVTRVSRIPVTKIAAGWVNAGAEQPLMNLTGSEAACQQFGSHASGDVVFGPDGMLYASAGDGASFDSLDYGQAGNPCGDPTNEGGGLRSQDIRTSGDPLGLGGTIFRIDPNGGQIASGAQANASRIVTYGQRNPWRLTFRPGTNELWSADVGASGWEEVNRTDMSSFTGPVNLGWPCYEGAYFGVQKQAGWDALDKPICENLYAAEASTPGTVRAPWFSYQTRGSTGPLTPGEQCEQGTSSISGVAFIPATSNYPAQYRGAMFFNDFARSCVWFLTKKANGDPDPTQIQPFVQRAESPVQITVGPGGDLYYVEYGLVNGYPAGGAGAIHRITYTTGNRPPVAAVNANPPAGPAPLNVSFNAGGSTDPDGDPLTYAWDLDGDGQYDDGTGSTQSRTYPNPGNVTVSVQVSDGRGGTDTESVVVSPGNSPPQITAMSPDATFTWSANQNITLTGQATDAQQSLPDSAFSWSVAIEHCPSVCHTHPLTGGTGRTVNFTAVGHEYPADLLVTLTVTDNQGLTDIETVKLDPKTADLTFATNPAGGAMTVAGAGVFSGHTQRFIQGSTVDVSVPDARTVGGANYTFTSWSDGGARSHSFNAPTSNATYTATYTRQNRPPTASLSANPQSGPAPLAVTFNAGATDPDGDNAGFTYEWSLDGDAVFDDGGGASKSKTYNTAGSRVVQVRVTDTHGGQDTDQITINVGAANQPPNAAIAADPLSGPAPLAVSFTAAGSTDPDGDPLTYAWDLDDDGQYDDATGLTASRSFSGVGAKTVRLRVTDNKSASDTESVVVTVTNRLPTVSLAANPTSGTPPLNTTFTATAADPDGTTLTYKWDLDDDGQFDDGGTAATQAASFSAVGPHEVTVEVTDANGGKATAAQTVTVTSAPNQPPTGYVYSSPGEPGVAPLTTTFYTVLTDPEGGPLTYAWDLDEDGQFDDGGTAATQQATFTKVGVNRIYVRGTDPAGGQVVAFATINVLNRNPTVSLAASPITGQAPLTTTFSASAVDPDATAMTYDWDTDNNGSYETPTGAAATLTRTYASPGTYTVGVQVTDADAGKATATSSVTASASNGAPSLGTVTPTTSFQWSSGGRIDVAATASDPQEGALPSSAFTWTLKSFACASGCTGVQVGSPINAATGFFTAPTLAYPAYLELTVTARDSGGLTATRTTRLDPRTVVLTLASSPSGLVSSTRTAIVGQVVSITAPDTVRQGNRTYRWTSWSDGGARTHNVTAPTSNRTYTATYQRVRGRLVFVTKPGDLQLKVAGESTRSGYGGTYDVGATVRVTAPKRQRLDGVVYEFVRWSDGGARVHDVTVVEGRLEIRAVYRRTSPQT